MAVTSKRAMATAASHAQLYQKALKELDSWKVAQRRNITSSPDERVREIIVKELGVKAKQVTDGAKLAEFLEANALDMDFLCFALEEEFGIEILDEEVEKVTTVGEAIACVQKIVGGWRVANKDFFVCQICGYTTLNKELQRCPVCPAPRSKFDTVR